MFKGSKKHHLYVFIFPFKRMSYSALETAVACQRTEPSLGRYEYKQKMSGECSTLFKSQLSHRRACLAADKGFSDAQIRALGRWKSDAFKL